MTTAAQVIAFGKGQLGTKEHPHGSNDTPYGAWYGLNGEPWCAMFQSWVLHHAGVTNFAIETPKGFSWTVAGVAWFKARGWWAPSAAAVPGDLVFFDFSGNGVADHVGMVLSQGSTMEVLEGNSGNGSPNNGGEVVINGHGHGHEVLGAGRMAHFYRGVSPATVPHVSWEYDNGINGHPQLAQGDKLPEVVKHLQAKLLLRGVNVVVDGVFGPKTHEAVVRFQAYRRLTADGTVGLHTWTALHV